MIISRRLELIRLLPNIQLLTRSSLLLIFLLVTNLQAQTVKLPARQIAQQTLPSTVSIAMLRPGSDRVTLGSGFFVANDIVATNFHVIAGATSGSIKVYGSERILKVLGTVGIDETNDLALLKIENVMGRPLKVSPDDSAGIGDDVYVVGNPEGLEGTFSQGIVSSLRKTANRNHLQITAAISHGSSGGPVLNDRGEVVGIAVGAIEGGQALNFSIPATYLRTLLLSRTSLVALSGARSLKVAPSASAPAEPSKRPRSASEAGYIPHLYPFGETDAAQQKLFGKVKSTRQTIYVPELKFDKWVLGEPASTELVVYQPSGYVSYREGIIYSYKGDALQYFDEKLLPVTTKQLRFYNTENRSLLIENHFKCNSCTRFQMGMKFVTIYGETERTQYDPDGTISWKTIRRKDIDGKTVTDNYNRSGTLVYKTVIYQDGSAKVEEDWRPVKSDPSNLALTQRKTLREVGGQIVESKACYTGAVLCFNERRLYDPVTKLELEWDFQKSFITKFEYEFDSKQNWIKRTTLRQVTKFDKTYFEPTEVVIRAIQYY